jgi:hypothetical protein
MTLAPGIHFDVPDDVYRADTSERPSLTQSLVKIILAKSPLHAWYAHPRLNPDFRKDEDRKFDVGNIAHTLLIGRGKTIEVIEGFDDWRTKAAKEKREEAEANGKLGVLGKHYALADRMVKAAREQLEHRQLDYLFRTGHGEAVIIWQEHGFYCRQMLDWLTPDLCTYADFKTTGESAAPHGLARKMVADGWPIQSAMAERGLDAINPHNAGRRDFLFVVQEDEPPYALTVAEIGEAARTMGRKQIEYAFSIWETCMEENQFPCYPLATQRPEYPGWAETEWLNRELEDEQRGPMLTSIAGG